MAKAGRLSSKLRSVLKKMNSFGNSTSNRKQQQQRYNLSRDNSNASSSSSSSSSTDLVEQRSKLQTVYVGRSMREYQVATELLDHPVMRDLAIDDNNNGSVIGCEVVLFDHLCWMLQQNAAAAETNQIQPLDDLAAFYAY